MVFRIRQNGEIIAETKGIKGKTCLKYVQEMERIAKAITKDSAFTDEYYENRNQLDVVETEEVRE